MELRSVSEIIPLEELRISPNICHVADLLKKKIQGVENVYTQLQLGFFLDFVFKPGLYVNRNFL